MTPRPGAKLLPLPRLPRETAQFETYKHCSELLGNSDVFELPPLTRTNGVAGNSSQTLPSALVMEARALAISGAIVPLFQGAAAVVAHGSGVVVVELARGGAMVCVECGLPVLSMVRTVGLAPSGTPDQEELVVASCTDGQLVVVAVSLSRSSSCLAARLKCSGKLPLREGRVDADVTEGKDLYVTAAHAREDGEVFVLAHHVTAKREVEVAVVQLGAGGCVRLATLCGRRIPRGSCWYGADRALLIADSGFSCSSSMPEEKDEESFERSEQDSEESVLTAMWFQPGSPKPEVACWILSGELLGAWVESGGSSTSSEGHATTDGTVCEDTAIGQGNSANSKLAVVLSDGCHGAFLFHLMLASASHAAPSFHNSSWVPGIAACASARAGLRLVLASPSRKFLALVEALGNSAVTIFGNPAGSSRAPTAALQLAQVLYAAGSMQDPSEVRGAFLLESAIVVLLRSGLVRTMLDASVRLVDVVAAPLSLERMPMGINRKALLQMLDRYGED